MGKHFWFSPSSAERIVTCPGSIELSRGVVREESEFAVDGTVAHAIARQAVVTGADVVDEEFESVQVYLDAIRKVRSQVRVLVCHVETKFGHATIKPMGGTMDYFMIYRSADDRLIAHVFDYKHGADPVETQGNKQLLSYFAIVKSRFPLVEAYRGTIVQPNTYLGFESPETWEVTPKDVEEFEQLVNERLTQNFLKSGEHCKYCPALFKCPAVESEIVELAKTEKDNSHLDAEKLARLYEIAPAARNLLGKIDAAILRLFQTGQEVPGMKVVRKQLGNRQWSHDQETTWEHLKQFGLTRAQAFQPPKLKSPAQIEKVLPDKKLKSQAVDQMVIRRETGFKVVPVDAKGTPVPMNEISMFESIDDDNDE